MTIGRLSSPEILTKAEPYKELKFLAIFFRQSLRTLTIVIELQGSPPRIREEFVHTADAFRPIRPYLNQPTKFEKSDCDVFNNKIVFINSRLDDLESQVTQLGSSSPNSLCQAILSIVRLVGDANEDIINAVEHYLMMIGYL